MRLGLVLAVLLAGCGGAATSSVGTTTPRGTPERGMASWYGPGFQGKKTASGERFDQHALTAAHKRLRFGTRVRVTNEKNGRSVIVRINDRGPYARGRVIDLSRAAAERIDLVRAGVAPVSLEIVDD